MKKTGCALIVGSGAFTDEGIREAVGRSTLVIAADAGLRYLEECGIRPDLIIGDYDSLGHHPSEEKDIMDPGEFESGEPRDSRNVLIPEILTLPAAKDDTDMAVACRVAWERGCREYILYGATGGRPDHLIGNLGLAASYSRRGAGVRIEDAAYTALFLTGGRQDISGGRGGRQDTSGGTEDRQDIPATAAGDAEPDAAAIPGRPGSTFSVFSWYERAEGVTISGDVRYPLQDATLENGSTLGVSNCRTGPDARLSVARGTLLLIAYRSPDAFRRTDAGK